MVDSNEIRKILGNNIRKLRLAKGLSQEQLAEAVGLERDSISSIETGRAFTSSETLAEFANHFNVEINYLFKSNNIEETDKIVDIKKEINRALSGCSHDFLKNIYKIIIALKI